VLSEICGEVGNVCEETVTDWFDELQIPLLNGTCLQTENDPVSLSVPLLTVLNI